MSNYSLAVMNMKGREMNGVDLYSRKKILFYSVDCPFRSVLIKECLFLPPYSIEEINKLINFYKETFTTIPISPSSSILHVRHIVLSESYQLQAIKTRSYSIHYPDNQWKEGWAKFNHFLHKTKQILHHKETDNEKGDCL